MYFSFYSVSKPLLLILFAAMQWLLSTAQAADKPIEISTGWVRETPPGARNAAAFMTLNNRATTDAKLVGVSCQPTLAARCEIHEHLHSDTGMRMQKISAPLAIKGNSSLALAPGGYHVMLLDIAAPLRKGATVELVLIFDDQSTVHAKLPIKPVKEE